jgi:CRP-like cAMP-binding protein
MSLNEEAELLSRAPLFAGIEPARLKLLAFTSDRLTFEPGQFLCKQGDPADAAFVIIQGEAEVLVETPLGSGALRPVATLRENDFLGEIGILCNVPRTASVRARTRMVTLRIARDPFFRLLEEFPQMAVTMMRTLAQRLEHTTTLLREALADGQHADRP